MISIHIDRTQQNLLLLKNPMFLFDILGYFLGPLYASTPTFSSRFFQVVENIKLPKHGGMVSCMKRRNVEGTERIFMARRHVDCRGFGETQGVRTLKMTNPNSTSNKT